MSCERVVRVSSPKWLKSCGGSHLNVEDSRGFFGNENILQLYEEFKEICEGRVRIDEITEVLKSFTDNKVPGIDKLPAEFYKAFRHLL